MVDIYVSLTTMFQRQRQCAQAIGSLLQQTLPPKEIWLYVSEKPHLLDKGIRRYCLDPSLTELTMKYPQLHVEWVENEGPYRKLLPFLKQSWGKENRLVVTCDDDVLYEKEFLKRAVELWKEKQCCIGFEGSRILPSFQYNSFPSAKGTQHLWNIATGVGGVLYETKWFSNKEIFQWQEFPYYDDLWFTTWRIVAGIPCYIHSQSSIQRSFVIKEGQSLWSSFNSKKNASALEQIVHLFFYKGLLQNQGSFLSKESQLLVEWNAWIQTHLLPLIQEPLEGSIWNKHLTKSPDISLLAKQKTIADLARQVKGKVCEIGFNAGFSALLLLLANPTLELTCLDLGDHSYTQPCFNKLQTMFGERVKLILGDSRQTMKELGAGFELVHVDGGHSEEVAKSDCQHALRILSSKGLLLLDDTNLSAVQNGIQPFLNQLDEISLPSSSSTYQHKLYRKKL